MATEPRIIGESAGSPVPDPGPGSAPPATATPPVTEHGGREGPEPTRFGDWEKNGRCIDF